MNPSIHQRARDLFMEITDLPDTDRAAALERACAGPDGAALRAEVDALLRAQSRAEGFMASPTGHADPTFAAPSSSASSAAGAASTQAPALEHPGQMIGRYKLLQPIGEGGFGSVWLAEQREPVKRRVALKVIKLGMDTRQVIARFEAERQALAMMDHPNIAKVLDAGSTDSGRPYFVMEYIKGVPILEYCDTEKLDTRARLDLFSHVCHAIQHAHQKGIIHRDIKPGNVLVTMHDGTPVPKVIDFGIAKATSAELTQKTLFTEHRQMIGTPAYMSPEQAEMSGLDIDTRSDIYSLGVLLYELLTGTTPFDTKSLLEAGFAEMLRVIREVEPARPSTRLSSLGDTASRTAQQRQAGDPKKLGTMLRGDLDWIVMKCLEKDRTRRYESASALAADIRRHLGNEPVAAGPPSAAYKARKFVRRNRGAVAAASLVAAALVLGVIGTTLGMVRAMHERTRADDQAAKAVLAAQAESKAKEQAQRRLSQLEKAAGILTSIFVSLDPREIARGGRPLQTVLAENLDKAISDLDGESVGDSRAVLDIQVQLGKSLLSLGEAAKATAVLEKARKTAADTLGPDDPTTLTCDGSLAMAHAAAGKLDQAISVLESLKARYSARPDPDADDLLSLTKHNLGLQYRQAGQFEKALPLFQEAVAARKAFLGLEHPYTLSSLNALATTYDNLGKTDLAVPLLEETVAAYRRTLGAEHPSALAAMNNLALMYSGTGRADRAVPLLEEMVQTSRARYGNTDPNTMVLMSSLGSAYRSAGLFDKAIAILEEALLLMRTRHGNDYPNTIATITTLGSACWAAGRFDKSVPLFEEAVALYTKNIGPDRPETQIAVLNLGVNYKDAGQLEKALPLLRKSHELSATNPRLGFAIHNLAETYARLGMRAECADIVAQAIAQARKSRPQASPALANDLARYGGMLLSAGDHAAAEPLLRETLAIRQKTAPDDWLTFTTMSQLGAALAGQSKFDQAEPLLLDAVQGLEDRKEKIPPAAAAAIPTALDRLINLYTATDKPGEAARWQSERDKHPRAEPDQKK